MDRRRIRRRLNSPQAGGAFLPEDDPAAKKVTPRACPRGDGRRIYLIVSAPALQTCSSWGAVPPLQPMAPITLPFENTGSPPWTAMAPRVRIGSAGGEPITASE